ncbi:MAG: protein kinase [Deinococcota bacterium]
MGTVAYMAPEQIDGKPASIQSDVWSWGTMLYEMLAGHVPFAHIQGIDMMLAIRDQPVPALPESLLEGADALTYQPLLDRCLARPPAQRASSMRDVLRYLAPLANTAASQSLKLTPSTIPVWHKPFVGREDVLDNLHHKLTAGARLITLSGQAGIGKTHTALTFLYGTDLHVYFPDGLLYIAATSDTGATEQPQLANSQAEQVTTTNTTNTTNTMTTGTSANVQDPKDASDDIIRAVDTLAEHIAKVLHHELGPARLTDYDEHETSVRSLPVSARDPHARAQAWAQALAKMVGERQLLLLIDGLEQPPAAVGQLLEAMTQHCSQLVMLVTTRSRLAVPSERVVALHALELPSGVQDLARRASSELFLSTSSRPLEDAERAELARLCHLLGGWPAALELAAHWHVHQNCASLIDAVKVFELGARQGLMGLRDLLETMWQTLSWQEAAALARLSSLGEQLSAETATYIAEVPLALLTALVDKNMLEVDGGIYRANPLIVAYAQHKLAAAPNLHAVLRQRLADYLARRLAGDAPQALTSSKPNMWSSTGLNVPTRLSQVEWRNLQAAWQVWLERPPKRLLTMISRLSQLASYASEDRTVANLFEQARSHFVNHTDMAPASTASGQAHLLGAPQQLNNLQSSSFGSTRSPQGTKAQQQRLYRLITMLTVYEARHHLRLRNTHETHKHLKDVVAKTLEPTGTTTDTSEMNSDTASVHYQRPDRELSLYPALAGLSLLQAGDRDTACQVYRVLTRRYPDSRLSYGDPLFLQLLGLLALRLEPAELQRAKQVFEMSAGSYRDDQDATGEALVQVGLGFLAWSQSNLKQAAEHLHKALKPAQLPALNTLQARILLAEVYFEQGQWQAATDHFDDVHSQALQLSRTPASLIIASDALAGLAKVASAQGDTIVAHAYLQQALEHAQHNPWRILESVAAILVRRKDIDDAALILAHLASYPASQFERDVGLDVPLPELRTRGSVQALIDQVQLFMNDANWQAIKTQGETTSLEMLLEHVQNRMATSEYSF